MRKPASVCKRLETSFNTPENKSVTESKKFLTLSHALGFFSNLRLACDSISATAAVTSIPSAVLISSERVTANPQVVSAA